MMYLHWKKLLLVFSMSFLAAGIGSFVTFPSIPTWYAGLTKPIFNPPNWVFGPVWTVLYILMAVSFYIVLITKEKKGKQLAIFLYCTQLVLNILWSVMFFGLHQIGFSIVIILYLWVSIFGMIIMFAGINKHAAKLQIPYLVWVSFATILNISLFLLN